MTQFLRDQASDSEEVDTPLMLDGTYLSRNFATLGPLPDSRRVVFIWNRRPVKIRIRDWKRKSFVTAGKIWPVTVWIILSLMLFPIQEKEITHDEEKIDSYPRSVFKRLFPISCRCYENMSKGTKFQDYCLLFQW